MDRKNTDDLRQELMSSPNLDEFLSDNEKNFSNESIPEILNSLLSEKNISKATLAKQSGISEVYLHQIFAGRRNPSRNRLLCLCYGLNASLDETQETFKTLRRCPALFRKPPRRNSYFWNCSQHKSF